LHSSSRHNLSENKQLCDELAADADCKETEETFEERLEYREWYKEQESASKNWAASNEAGKREAAAADELAKDARQRQMPPHRPPMMRR